MRHVLASSGLLLLACLVMPAAHADVLVTDNGETSRPVTDGPAKGSDLVSHGVILNNGPTRYGLNTVFYVDKNGVARSADEGYLGMPVPASDNWYGGGFLDVIANGKSLGGTKPLPLRVVERGRRGLVELLFPTSPAPVRLRFLLEQDSDYLACEIASAKPMASLALRLLCFPSYFTAWNHKDGWRQIITPTRTLEQGQNADLPGATDWWLFYQDRIFDVATNADSDGPCAALMLPEQVQTIHPDVGSYGVPTSVLCKPALTSLRIAFWDFHQQPNATALKHLRDIAPQVAERLRKLDFNDSRVAAVNAQGERARLDALIAHSSDPAKWQAALMPMFEAITTATQAAQAGDFLAEQKAAEAITKYREALWDVKFDALLND